MKQDSAACAAFARRLARMDDCLMREIEAQRIPGAAWLAWRAGSIVHQAALGWQDAQQRQPMTADSLFRIYSMTKPVVSVAVMMLVEQGRLSIGEPVSHHLPELSQLMVGVEIDGAEGKRLALEPARREITVQDLLRHTSGITYSVFGDSLVKALYRESSMEARAHSNQDMVAHLSRLPLFAHPGSTWEYGRSTDVLGALVERISGEPLDVFLERHIFSPLGMQDTGFWVGPDKLPRLAQPFETDPDTGQPIQLIKVSRKPLWLAGGHGLVSTLADYLRFARMLAAGGSLDGVRILGARTVEFMTADHLAGMAIDRHHPSYLPGPGYGFGLGFAVRTEPGAAPMPGSVGDYSWSGMAGTYFWVDPREDLIAIYMMQAPGQGERFRHLLRNVVYAAL